MKRNNTNRRNFLKATATVAGGYWLGTSVPDVSARSANEKLNIACIGVGGRGSANVGGVSGENIVAMCDVDESKAGKRFQEFNRAGKFKDYRVMFDKVGQQLDAVVISTPDHTHFHPARQAMLEGKHVYCEKPLAHSAWEIRQLTRIAAQANVATQLGNQRHANAGMARAVEAVQSGMVGKIKEVYCAIGGSRGMPPMPKDSPPIPNHLDWKLWQGPVAQREYAPDYVPYKWRFWWDYGTGETGNWGCHILDIPYWALGLKYPTRVDLDVVPTADQIDAQRTPKSMKTRMEYKAENGHDAVILHWWHGDIKEVFVKHNAHAYGNTLFIGEKGTISAGFSGYKAKLNDGDEPKVPSPSIPKSPGFYKEWINACKGGQRSTCDFVNYSGALSETVLLANAAYRSGGGFDWDATAFKSSGNAKVAQYINAEFAKGWEVDEV